MGNMLWVLLLMLSNNKKQGFIGNKDIPQTKMAEEEMEDY